MRMENRLVDLVRQGKSIDIEEAFLIFSGLTKPEDIIKYQAGLSQIEFDISSELEQKGISSFEHEKIAEVINDILWIDKPKRYNSNTLLKDVIDCQLSQDKMQLVGNCVGLTSLITVLGLRYGLDFSIIATTNPYHVFTCFKPLKGEKIYIENTCRTGFNINLEDKAMKYNLKMSDFLELDNDGLLAITLNNKAANEKERGNLLAAHHYLKTATEFNNQVPFIFVNLGNIKYDLDPNLEEPKEIIKEYDRAIELKPDYSEAYFLRARCRNATGDWEKALDDYNEAIRHNPLYADACNSRARLRRKMGDLEGAMGDFKIVTTLEPNNMPALKDLANVKIELGKHKEALEDVDWMIVLEPDNAHWYHFRARLRKKTDDMAGALSDYETAEELYKSKAQ